MKLTMDPRDLISFDDSDLSPLDENNGARFWLTGMGDGIFLFHFAKPPDIGANLDSLTEIRTVYRASANGAGLGLIEAEVISIDGAAAIRTIFKSPQQPTGMTYIGSLTFPFRDFSYVLKVQCQEQGVTGIREAVVLDSMLEAGEIEFDDAGVKGWMRDPYDPTADAPLMRNLAEDEQYDAQFPDHPLSRLRSILRKIEVSLRLAPEVKNAAPFVHTVSETKKPWWKRW